MFQLIEFQVVLLSAFWLRMKLLLFLLFFLLWSGSLRLLFFWQADRRLLAFKKNLAVA